MKRFGALAALAVLPAFAQQAEQPGASNAPAPAAPVEPPAAARTELNLLGRTDAQSGESRRNENVAFTLLNNNALQELNLRVGITATPVEEFRADRGYYGAEFGNKPPAPVHLAVGKPGPLHGSAFVSHLNSVFNARSFFTVGGLPPARENQYGFTVSSRVWRGGFLTLDGQQQRVRGNVNGNVLVPLASERTPLVADPVRRALLQRFVDAFPKQLPNRTDINARALNTNAPQEIDDDIGSLRLDQKFGEGHTLSLRHSFTLQKVDAFQLVAGQNPDTTTRNHTAQATWTAELSPSALLAVTGAFDRTGSLLVPEPNAVGPQVNFSNFFTTLGPSSQIPINRVQNRFRAGAGVTLRRGYFGADLARRRINGAEVSSHRGNLYFRNDFGRDAIQNFLLGTPSRFSGASGEVHRGFRQWEGAVYAGGAARVRPGLDLWYGVRYETVGAPSEVDGLTVFPYKCDCNNVAPRFGFAARLPRGLGVLRGAYGLHYGEIFTAVYTQVRFNPPRVVKFEVPAPDLLAPFGQLNVAVDPNGRAAVYRLNDDLRAPYSHQYNLTWEPFETRRWRLQLGYVGSRTHGLLMLVYYNRARVVPGLAQTTATVNERRPDARYFDLRRVFNGSRAYFDAGRATLVLPRARGLSLDASYWYSKAIDLGAPYTSTASSDDQLRAQSQTENDVWGDLKGASGFDQRHAFLARASWRSGAGARALKNWEISGVALLKTGTPFTVITGSDGPGFGNVDGDTGDRPHVVDPRVLGRAVNHPDTSRAAMPAGAFAFPRPTDARGNLGTNTFRRDGIANVNASLGRTFSLTGDKRLLVRAEAINALNTPQFAEPWRELASPSFGAITNTLNEGRTFRFLARFSF